MPVLTDAFIKSIQPPATPQKDISDAATKGLYIRVGHGGSKVWYFRYRHRKTKKLERIRIGEYPGIGLSEARVTAREIRAQLDRGRDPKQIREHEQESRSVTVADAVELYIKRHCEPNQRSWKETQRVLSHDLVRKLGGMALVDIERKHLIQLLDGVTDRGSRYAANALHRQLRAFFNWCEGRTMIEITPMRKIKTPHKVVERHRVLDLKEIAALYRAGRKLPYPWGPWLILLILTGQRKNSVAMMRWEDIDREMETWTIPGESTKNAKPLVVPLSKQAKELLASLPHHSNWVLSTTSAKPIYSDSGKSKNLFDEASKVSAWRIHDIRRSVATHLAANGVDRLTIERILGHTDPSVTAVYERYDRHKERRNALQLWADMIELTAAEK